ncbi:MAG: hypothetical protein R2710_08085 [Acidimicrobiales bacterium]
MDDLETFASARPQVPPLTEAEKDAIWERILDHWADAPDQATLVTEAEAPRPVSNVELLSAQDAQPVRRGRRTIWASAAAIVVLGLGAAMVSTLVSGSDETGRSKALIAATEAEPILIPAVELGGGAAPGSIVPALEAPPVDFGPFVTAQRAGGWRNGYWTATAIAQRRSGAFVNPIMVTAFEGRWQLLDDAKDIVIDGTRYRQAAWGSYTVLATDTSPTIAASGNVELGLLRDVLASARVDTTAQPYRAAFAGLPDGYEQFVPYRELGVDSSPRTTLAETSGTLTINEVTDWVDPLLYAASTGSTLTPYDVAVGTAWAGDRLRFLWTAHVSRVVPATRRRVRDRDE